MTEQITSEPRTEPNYDDYLGIPVHFSLKAEIRALARAEERDMTSMARALLKEAIAARGQRSEVRGQGSEVRDQKSQAEDLTSDL